VTPILASVLAFAAAGGDIAHSATLLALYSAGLGVPCLAVSLAFNRLAVAIRFTRAHAAAITSVSTVAMLGFGTLLVLNSFSWITINLQKL
jgi:cytochrome c-type biogenesis protein